MKPISPTRQKTVTKQMKAAIELMNDVVNICKTLGGGWWYRDGEKS